MYLCVNKYFNTKICKHFYLAAESTTKLSKLTMKELYLPYSIIAIYLLSQRQRLNVSCLLVKNVAALFSWNEEEAEPEVDVSLLLKLRWC